MSVEVCQREKLPSHNLQLLDEVEKNIVICLWRADQLWQVIELRDNDKSRLGFAITEFKNCFII